MKPSNSNQIEVVKKNNGYELVIMKNATIKDYEIVLGYLTNKLNITDIKEINDFDSYYHFLNYNGNKLVAHFSIYLEISLILFDGYIGAETQQQLIKELLQVLSGMTL